MSDASMTLNEMIEEADVQINRWRDIKKGLRVLKREEKERESIPKYDPYYEGLDNLYNSTEL